MNVASLGLCKDLYELSGWGSKFGETDFYAVDKKGWEIGLVVNGSVQGNVSLLEWDKSIPAYSLGYLMRKLPASVDLAGAKCWFKLSPMDAKTWGVCYRIDEESSLYFNYSEDPEDALCKLAINLFSSNLLKKEG